MRSLRSSWIAALTAVLLLVGIHQQVAACFDPAQLTVTQGQGNKFSGLVTSPDNDPWEGFITLTFEVDGTVYTFSFAVNIPSGSQIAWTVRLTENGTLFNANACEDPGGGTESPDPVAGIVYHEEEL